METEVRTPHDLRRYRKEAERILTAMPWPDKKNELWRRTPLSLFEPESFKTRQGKGETQEPHSLPLPEGSVILCNGSEIRQVDLDPGKEGNPRLSLEESDLSFGREEDTFYPTDWTDRFSAWGDSETTRFLFLDFPAHSVMAEPLSIVLNTPGRDNYALPRIFLRCGPGWSGQVLVFYNGARAGQDRVMVNGILRGFIGENSHVGLTEIQNLGLESRLVQNTRFTQQADSSLLYGQLHLGAGAVKSDNRFGLAGRGADLQIQGLSACGKGQHKDVRLVQQHLAPQTNSRANFKAFVQNRGRSVFQGLIRVEKDAAGTDAYLTNKNLILSDRSRADAIPSLKILTDDVKCSHGSTTGRLDPDQIFYLISRGLSPRDAAELLIEGQMGEVLEHLPPDLRDWAGHKALENLNRGT